MTIQTVEELHDHVLTLRDGKEDVTTLATNVTWTDDKRIIVTPEDGDAFDGAAFLATPTDHAFSQACGLYGTGFYSGDATSLPVRTYSNLFADHVMAPHAASIMNRHAVLYQQSRKNKPRSNLVRLDGDNARAFMSDQYTTVDMHDITEHLVEFVAATEYNLEVVKPHIDRDGMRVDFMAYNRDTSNRKDGGDGVYGVGFRVQLDEVGRGGLRGYGITQRHSCTNSIVIRRDNTAISMSHVGSREAILHQYLIFMARSLNGAEEAIDKMMIARRKSLYESMDSIISGIVESRGWEVSTIAPIARGTEGEDTVAGLVNGLTWAAHQEGVSPDQGHEMETLAGDLLFYTDAQMRKAQKQYANFIREQQEERQRRLLVPA